MTRFALTATIAANVTHLAIAPLADTIRTHATALRAQGADIVVVTAHAGGRCTEFDRPEDLSSCNANDEIFTVARELPAGLVDAIVAGHTHASIGHQVAGIPITEALSNGRAFGRIDLLVDRASKKVVGKRSYRPMELVPGEYEGTPVVPDAAIERCWRRQSRPFASSSHVPSGPSSSRRQSAGSRRSRRWDSCSATRCSRGRRAPTPRSTTRAAAFAPTSPPARSSTTASTR